MSFALATAKKDVQRKLRDPFAILLWLGIPIVIGAMLKFAFGGSNGASPQASILVVDEDDSFLSDFLLSALSADRGPTMPFTAESVDGRDEGRARIDDGDASALLIIPAGFSDALLLEEPCTLELVTNPAQRILPGMVEEALTMLVDASFYLHRVFGEPMRAIVQEPPPDRDTLDSAEVARISVQINDIMERALALLTPPVIKLVAEETAGEAEDDAAGLDFATLFFPSMLFMTLFFLAQGMSEDLWVERDAGTLRRALTTPNHAAAFVLGKVLAALIFVAGVTAGGVLLAQLAFGVALNNVALAITWATLAGAMLVLFLFLLQLFATSQRAGNLLTTLVTMPLLMLGGSFFPFEAMPSGMASIGRMTPNGWALEQLKSILSDTIEPSGLATAFAGVLAICVVLFLLTSRRIAGAFVRS